MSQMRFVHNALQECVESMKSVCRFSDNDFQLSHVQKGSETKILIHSDKIKVQYVSVKKINHEKEKTYRDILLIDSVISQDYSEILKKYIKFFIMFEENKFKWCFETCTTMQQFGMYDALYRAKDCTITALEIRKSETQSHQFQFKLTPT